MYPLEDASLLNLVDPAVSYLLFLDLLFYWISKINSLSIVLQLFTMSSVARCLAPCLLILECGGAVQRWYLLRESRPVVCGLVL